MLPHLDGTNAGIRKRRGWRWDSVWPVTQTDEDMPRPSHHTHTAGITAAISLFPHTHTHTPKGCDDTKATVIQLIQDCPFHKSMREVLLPSVNGGTEKQDIGGILRLHQEGFYFKRQTC